MDIYETYHPRMSYTAKALTTSQMPTIDELHEMVNGYLEKRILPFTVICENVDAFMKSRSHHERLVILNAYATIRENPLLGGLGLAPGLYKHPGPDRIYYHIVTKPETE